jgi:hypothetical protein
MTKKMLEKEIKRIVKECDNIQLLHLVYLVLLKADKIDLTAPRCSSGMSDTN